MAEPAALALKAPSSGFMPDPTLLRAGGLPAEAIEACLGRALSQAEPSERPNAPGQLESHYAPKAALRLNANGPGPRRTAAGIWRGGLRSQPVVGRRSDRGCGQPFPPSARSGCARIGWHRGFTDPRSWAWSRDQRSPDAAPPHRAPRHVPPPPTGLSDQPPANSAHCPISCRCHAQRQARASHRRSASHCAESLPPSCPGPQPE